MVMTDWIPFPEGEYGVEKAFLLGDDFRAVLLNDPFIEIYKDKKGYKHLKGMGQVETFRVVELLEDTDHPDLVLDLGAGYRYVLKKPNFKAGKVFAPSVSSSIQFYPDTQWEPISDADYTALYAKIILIPPLPQ